MRSIKEKKSYENDEEWAEGEIRITFADIHEVLLSMSENHEITSLFSWRRETVSTSSLGSIINCLKKGGKQSAVSKIHSQSLASNK